MRDVVTKERRLSLAGHKPRIIPEYYMINLYPTELINPSQSLSCRNYFRIHGNIFAFSIISQHWVAQLVEILPRGKQWLVYPAESIAEVLLTWGARASADIVLTPNGQICLAHTGLSQLTLNFCFTASTNVVHVHWNIYVIIFINFSLIDAPEVVKMTNSGASSDENFIKMMTFPFQCLFRHKQCTL